MGHGDDDDRRVKVVFPDPLCFKREQIFAVAVGGAFCLGLLVTGAAYLLLGTLRKKPRGSKLDDQGDGVSFPKQFAAAASTIGELVGILVLAAVLQYKAGSAAGPILAQQHQEDPKINWDALWSTYLVLFLFSLSKLKWLPNEKDRVLCNKDQTSEWKGWMMVCFILNHDRGSNQITPFIRCLVSAFVLLSGFGNAMSYWGSRFDFSFRKLAKALFRVNFLSICLSLTTGTPWSFYYFVFLIDCVMVVLYVSFLAAAELIRDRERGEAASLKEKAVGALIFSLLMAGLGQNFIYKPALGYVVSAAFGHRFSDYFGSRVQLDWLSPVYGLLLAAALPTLRTWGCGADNNNNKKKKKRNHLPWSWLACSLLLFATWLGLVLTQPYGRFKGLHPYVGCFPIPMYLVLRNWNATLRSVYLEPMAVLGTCSLELFLLQWHLFMVEPHSNNLLLIPSRNYLLLNYVLASVLLISVSRRAATRTAGALKLTEGLFQTEALRYKRLFAAGAALGVALLAFAAAIWLPRSKGIKDKEMFYSLPWWYLNKRAGCVRWPWLILASALAALYFPALFLLLTTVKKKTPPPAAAHGDAPAPPPVQHQQTQTTIFLV